MPEDNRDAAPETPSESGDEAPLSPDVRNTTRAFWLAVLCALGAAGHYAFQTCTNNSTESPTQSSAASSEQAPKP